MDIEINTGNAKEIIADIRGQRAIYNTKEKILKIEDEEIQVESINNRINLRILVDRCSVEIFLNEGAQAVFISTLIDPANLGYSFEATGGKAKIEKAEFYSLKSSWE
jgi:sucrose-6-phosphate hydrolase SacC (GH32 family)